MDANELSWDRRIEGAPNFRRVPLVLQLEAESGSPSPNGAHFTPRLDGNGKYVGGRCVYTVSADIGFDDRIISQRNAYSSRVRRTLS
jgi:hypothetical protein